MKADKSDKGRLLKRIKTINFKEHRSTVGLIALIVLVKSIIVDYHPIPSKSMVPTLEVNDLVLANRLAYGVRIPFVSNYAYRYSSPDVGDVVVFENPTAPGWTFNSWIKRVIATEGGRVKFSNKSLYINGKLVPCEIYEDGSHHILCEETLDNATPDHKTKWMKMLGMNGDFTEEYIVPKDHVFVVGDNRNNSNDSRFWGSIHIDSVYGKHVGTWKDASHYANYALYFLIALMLFEGKIKSFFRKRKSEK